jgi:hypothetical protein
MILKYYSKAKNKYLRVPIAFILLLFTSNSILFYFLGDYSKDSQKEKIIKKKIIINQCADEADYLDFNEENFKKYLKTINIKFPDIVYIQAYHETNGFKSDLFKSKSNLFGMKVPAQRGYLSECDTCKYSVFKDKKLSGWQLSVIDYALWQNKYGNYETKENYLKYLGKIYSEDSLYKEKIINLLNKNHEK